MPSKATPTPNPSTARTRLIEPNGSVIDFQIQSDTPPEQIENLLSQAKYLVDKALELGFIPANQTQGKQAVAKQAAGVKEGNGFFHCVSMDILPLTGGNAKVALFGDEHKQPRDDFATVTINNWAPEALQKALAPYYEFKLETFQRAVTFDVDFMVEWYPSSKINQAGNPYKNLARGGIKPIEGGAAPAIAEAPAPPAPAPSQPQSDGNWEMPPEQQDIPF